MKILFGHSDALADIAAKLIPDMGDKGFGPCQALGVVSGYDVNDRLEAVCVYHEYHPEHKTIMMSIAAYSPRWAQRGIIRALLSVSFRQYGVKKVWCITSINNKRCQKFLKGIGFKKEATLAHHLGEGVHAEIYRMMEQDFRARYENNLQTKKNSVSLKLRGDVSRTRRHISNKEGVPLGSLAPQPQQLQIQ